MFKIKTKIVFLIIATLFVVVGCSSEQGQESELVLVQEVDFVLGTMGQIQVFAESKEIGNEAIRKAYDRIKDIENTMSTSIEGSDVYQVNLSAGQSYVDVSQDTLFVINKGLEYFDLTDGTFNIGLGKLINLWGIGKENERVPSQDEIQKAKAHIDIQNISIDNGSVKLEDPEMAMDLGGIAKGYAVDEAINVLKDEGINSGLVNLGGDIYALGNKADGDPWNVGIQNPDSSSGSVVMSIALADKSIVSSGDYERYFVENNVKYHHILDPETGYPTDNEVRSVTIISDASIDADILSTAVFIMGLERGLELLESLEGVDGVVLTKEKEIYTTSNVEGLNIIDNTYTLIN
ncbi:FAD:protein FMN transferase [Serpentinicella sp. ANB-PHB4]|uniref:FAD:protein FMN transferase n=1 Tax=Serpentinicella sp. ANB-PHB4 TaxID=3074076 RepID=UPI00285CA68B|nr:FAD:protein FMN transferase [Serpentinicella sp. ANB-PHB4]MDR5660069.1 FAD:protein FMN transferase [Serpentinicella sp. ANB-PHB4]